MRILVFHERQLERDAIVTALLKASNNVRVATDAKDFFTALASQPEVVVIGAIRSISAETVKAVRAACATSYLIVISDVAADIAPSLKAAHKISFAGPSSSKSSSHVLLHQRACANG